MLIGRYIFRQTASALIMILISLTLIVWLTSLLREIKLLTSQGQTFILFMKITSLAIPNLLVTVAPVAFLIASLHTLNRLAGDSELIVLSASGASVWRLLAPYCALAIVVSMSVLLCNLFLLPKAAELLGIYTSQVRSDLLSQVLQPGEFSDLERGLTVHIRDKDKNGDLLGVVMSDERDPKMTTTVIATRGEVLSEGQRSVMQLYDGQILRQPTDKDTAQIVVFKTYAFDVGDFTPKTGPREARPRERSLSDLLTVDRNSEFFKYNAASIRSEIHERLSTPLYPFVFMALALAYLGRPRTTREGRATLLFTAFALGAALRILGIAGVNVVGKNPSGAILIYGSQAVVFGAAMLLLALNQPAPVLALPQPRLPNWLRTGLRRGSRAHAA